MGVGGVSGGDEANGSRHAAIGEMITFGMFPGLNKVTDEDFKAAVSHSHPDDGLDWP